MHRIRASAERRGGLQKCSMAHPAAASTCTSRLHSPHLPRLCTWLRACLRHWLCQDSLSSGSEDPLPGSPRDLAPPSVAAMVHSVSSSRLPCVHRLGPGWKPPPACPDLGLQGALPLWQLRRSWFAAPGPASGSKLQECPSKTGSNHRRRPAPGAPIASACYPWCTSRV